MSTIHLVGGEKGGVGKSVLARLLLQYCIDEQLPFVGVDADVSHGALLRYYNEYSQAADLESFSSADQIMDRALASERRVIVDLPAQSARALKRWMDAADVVTFAREMGVGLVVWHVTDGGYDSVNELQRVADTFGDTVRYVVVKNLGRSTDFGQLNASPALATVSGMGGRVATLPALDSETMYKIDRFGSSFWAAAHRDEGELALGALARRRAQRWLKEAYEAIRATECV